MTSPALEQLAGRVRSAARLVARAPSSIRDDGEDGPLPNGDHSGTAGGTITIAARQVILLGTISASGGAGLDGGDGFGGGDGGAGGTITLLAGNLDLAGKISADGGGGGMNGMCTANAGPDCSNPIPGNGGNGGTVTVQLLPPLNQGLRRQITALPGSGGFNSIAKNGQDGIAGTVVLSALSAAQGADLPDVLGRRHMERPAQLFLGVKSLSQQRGGELLFALMQLGERDLGSGPRSRDLCVEIAPDESAYRNQYHDPECNAGYPSELERGVVSNQDGRGHAANHMEIHPMPCGAITAKPGDNLPECIEEDDEE